MTALIPRPRLLSLFEAMATPHQLDRYLELVDPMLSVRDVRGKIVGVQRFTDETVTLTIRPTRQWRGFRAGQFVQVGVVIDGVRHTRCYSPATSEHGGRHFELTIKAHPDGLVSRHLHRTAEVGTVVSLSQAGGTFQLPQQRPEHVLLISGGSGITPVLSMLRTLHDERHRGPITFLHYANTVGDVPHRAELRALERHNVNVVLLETDYDGFFGIEHLERVAPWFRDAQTFLCGPGPLMRSVRELYRELDLESALHTEEFAPALTVVAGGATGTTNFTASGVLADNNGASLLEQAESAGLTPEYGCRMGICFSCTSIKRSGCTRNLRTGETDSDPDQPVQLCISAAVGDVEIEI